jgi:hypothetical protein
MCKTTTTTPEQTTPDRVLRILQRIDQTGRGSIRITEKVKGKLEVKEYQLATFPAYGGEAIGITFAQVDGKVYDLCIQGKKSHCDCPWGSYGAHKKPCRHVAAGLKLQAMGELHLPMTQDNNDDEHEAYDLAEAALCWDVAECY